MPKMKTNKAASKRFSFTATGKIKRTKANRRHLLAAKTKRTKKTARVQDGMVYEGLEKNIKTMLPYGKRG